MKKCFKRQKFHRPCKSVMLENENLLSFITSYNFDDTKSIFWMDYTSLEYNYFTDFQHLLTKVTDGSMIKITLRSDPKDYPANKSNLNGRRKSFCITFRDFMPDPHARKPTRVKDFANLLQDMIVIAAQKILVTMTQDRKFIPVSSFYYRDTTWMFTLTGVICRGNEEDKIKQAFKDWKFANLTERPPTQIKVPNLSTKERMHLQPLLPTKTTSVKRLRSRLGYLIEMDDESTNEALEQYAKFHRHTPYFLRGIP